MDNLLIARQSIFDADLHVVAYELILHDPHNVFNSESIAEDQLTELFQQLKTQEVLGDGQIIINFTDDMFDDELNLDIEPEKLIISIDETRVKLDKFIIASLKHFRQAGFSIAAKNYSNPKDWQAINQFVGIVRLDMSTMKVDAVQQQVTTYQNAGFKILAENIDSHETFELCKTLGIDLFSGTFLSKPHHKPSDDVSANRSATLQLLVALDDPEISIAQVEEILSQDARLSYRLLRIINSAAYGLQRKIESLQEAINFMGLVQLRSWASVIIVTSQEGKPTDLMTTTMIRAKMMELLGEFLGVEYTRTYFMTGLLSTLDALFDQSMRELLAEIPLNEAVTGALLRFEDTLGHLLHEVIFYEQGHFDEVSFEEIDASTWSQIYLESVNWATVTMNQLES